MRDNSGQVIAIVPSVTTVYKINPFGNLRALVMGANDHLDGFDVPMHHSAEPALVANSLVNAMEKHSFRWQVAVWPRAFESSNVLKIWPHLRLAWTIDAPAEQCNTFQTDFREDGPKSQCVFPIPSSKLRNNLARYRKRLNAMGEISIRSGRELNCMFSYYEEFLRIEASGWKGRSGAGTAISLNSRREAYHASLLKHDRPDYRPDVLLLCCNDKPIAGRILITTSECIYSCKTAYDEEYAKGSPSNVLLQHVLDTAMQETTTTSVNLLTEQSASEQWGPTIERTWQLVLFRDPFRPTLLRAARRLLKTIRNRKSS